MNSSEGTSPLESLDYLTSALWNQLRVVSRMSFTSVSRTGTGWSGEGGGEVVVVEESPDVLVFKEAGEWSQSGGATMRFRNVYRWTWLEEGFRLEHLRFGVDRPVFLFDAVPDGVDGWKSAEPHACRSDAYSATVALEEGKVRLKWTVFGPERDEEMEYWYWCGSSYLRATLL